MKKLGTSITGIAMLICSAVMAGEPLGRYSANPYGAGSQYRSDSPNNPYGEGLKIIGV